MVRVAKFGGSSVASAEQFRKVKNIVQLDDSRRFVVVSAVGKADKDDNKVTDLLYLCYAHIKYNINFDNIFKMIEDKFINIKNELGLNYDIEGELAKLKSEIKKGIDEEYLVSRGEYLTGLLMAEYLGFHFVDAKDLIYYNYNGEIDYSDITLRDIEYTKCEKKKLKYGDIILEKSGGTDVNPVGRVVFFDKNDPNDVYLTNNFTTTLRVKDNKINSRFLLLFLLYNYKYKGVHKFYNKTTGIQNLQVSNLIKNIYVPLPEINIQSAIVEILDKIKNIIKRREKQIILFDELIKSRFIEMFGDPIKNYKGWEIKKLFEVADV